MLLVVAPIKALCSQRFESWKQKFGPLGLNCKELTGDTEIDEVFEIQDAHIIMTTPVRNTGLYLCHYSNKMLQEIRAKVGAVLFKYIVLYIFCSQEKWDSMTRKWKDNCLLQLVRLFLIDEVSV